MKTSSIKLIFSGVAVGLAVGVLGTFLFMKNSQQTAGGKQAIDPDPSSASHETSTNRTKNDSGSNDGSGDKKSPLTEREEWNAQLDKLSTKWISADGQQSAQLDYRILRFGGMPDWPDLDHKDFLLGREMQFLTESGVYTISTLYSDPDSIRLIKEDRKTKDLCGITLYREGSKFANSRQPLPKIEIPEKIKNLLAATPSIRKGDSVKSVMERLGLIGDPSLVTLGGQSGLGEADETLDLDVGGEWMLRLKYKESGSNGWKSGGQILRFQVIRGYVADAHGDGPRVEQIIYPYYVFGKIVSGAGKAEDARND